jgi:hypothetical protein
LNSDDAAEKEICANSGEIIESLYRIGRNLNIKNMKLIVSLSALVACLNLKAQKDKLLYKL